MDPQFLATATLPVHPRCRVTPLARLQPLDWRLVAAAVNRGEESSGCATTAITTTTSNMY
jgi:hypothetical protein